MSGKKQHYIPKVLLRGFRANDKGTYGQAFVYKANKAPYPASIGDIAAERYFYSDIPNGPSETVDERITQYENRLTALLLALHDVSYGETANPLVAAEVVAHLSVRGAHLREIFSFGVRQLLEETSTRLSDANMARELVFSRRKDVEQRVDAEIDAIKYLLPASFPIPLFKRLILGAARENFDRLYSGFLPQLQDLLHQMTAQLRSAMRAGHKNVFDNAMAPDARVSDLRELVWHVKRTDTSLILPDCVALSVDPTWTSTRPYLLADAESVGAILLPLANKQILVGLKAGAPDLFHDFDFNTQGALCSASFFVASCDSHALRVLAHDIGKASLGTIGAIVAEALSNAMPTAAQLPNSRSNTPLTEWASAETYVHEDARPTISYRVTFRGCATEQQAKAIADAVGAIVESLTPQIRLDHLFAIEFAEDYVGALSRLDKDLNAPERSTTQVDGLVGVASTTTAIVGGEIKSTLVFRSWIGHGLISDDESAVRASAHLLTSMLAQSAFTRMEKLAFGGPGLHAAPSDWDALLYGPMSGVPTGYFSAWMSADIDQSAADTYREVVLKLMEHANRVVSEERLAYGSHGDIDRFLEAATGPIGDFLVAVAKLIGHCDASNSSIFDDGKSLESMLEQHGLVEWIRLYAQDLRRIFANRGAWSSLSELTDLSAHMERQLWRYLVFPWVLEDGRVRVEVPPLGLRVAGTLDMSF